MRYFLQELAHIHSNHLQGTPIAYICDLHYYLECISLVRT